MDRYRPYNGKRSISRRRHSTHARSDTGKSSGRAVKLFICAGIFVLAALTKLLFPSAINAVADKVNSVVNYKAALTALGQGISGEKKFVTALGEAFTYAFTGESPEAATDESQAQPSAGDESEDIISSSKAASDSATGLDSADVSEITDSESTSVFGEESTQDDTDALSETETTADTDPDAAAEDAVPNAIIAAFMQSQEEFSDYAIPAGVTYDMPRISLDYTKPAEGVVSSSFGYRIHPVDKTVKFHYGTDIVNKKGTPITAFADGKVIATGESTTLGNYVILYHGDIESQYAHCDSVLVTSGQTIKKGDKIATIGDTGNATETCLHFELKVSGQYVNPEFYIQW